MKTIAILILLAALNCLAGSGASTGPADVVIESVLVDGQTNLLSGQSPSIIIPPRRKQIEIHFNSPNIAAPDQGRYRFRLEGLDEDWTEGSHTTVSYRNLPAGNYRFRVEAADTNGTWNGNHHSLMITVEGPKLLLTMLAPLVLVVIGIIWFLLVWRGQGRKRTE